MKLKSRYAWGFRLGKLEHNYRYFSFKVLLIGVGLLILNYFYPYGWLFITAVGVIILAAATELISLGFHLGEKRLLNSVRHPKGKR